MRMLELGCGDNPRVTKDCTYYVGIDSSRAALSITQEKLGKLTETGWNVICLRLGFDTIPIEDNSFDFVLGDQFLEHVPRVGFAENSDFTLPGFRQFNPVIDLLNEVCRVTRPGGLVQFNVPKWNSQEMWQDPTHCNPVPPNFWIYWDPKDEWGIKKSYGIEGSLHLYETVDAGWYHIFKLRNIKFK